MEAVAKLRRWSTAGGLGSGASAFLALLLVFKMADDMPMSMMSMSSMSSSMLISTLESQPTPTYVIPDPKYACVKCHETLTVPQQTPCGHRIDRKCVEELFEGLRGEGVTVMCPAGEEGCFAFTRETIYPDYSVLREMRSQKVYCHYQPQGCDQIVPLQKFKDHITHCTFRVEECRVCKGLFPLNTMQSHVDTDCPETYCQCPFLCIEAPSEGIKRGQLDAHFEHCTAKPRKCPFSKVGCQFEGHATAMESHAGELRLHLDLLLLWTTSLQAENEKLKEKLQDYESSQNFDEFSPSDSGHYSLLFDGNKKLKNALESFQQECVEIKSIQTKQAEVLQAQNKKLQQLEEQLQALANSVVAGTRDRAASPAGSQGHANEDRVAQVERKHAAMEHSFRRFEVDLRCLATVSHDGVLLWPIHHYSRRKAAAVKGQTLSIFSQPFYTHIYGYKLCARVYLNGDGQGLNRYLSLFVMIMKGDYDALLPWPFQQLVTLSVVDQSRGAVRRDVRDAFRPDTCSSSFERPVDTMNIASGSPMFVEQQVLEAPDSPYLRDDTLVIKVAVDTTNAFAR